MATIYQNYTQQELDHQYNAQATVGDIAPFIETYIQDSAAARAGLTYQGGLAYGPDWTTRQRLLQWLGHPGCDPP